MTDQPRMPRCYGRKAHEIVLLGVECDPPRVVLACCKCGAVRLVDPLAESAAPIDDMDAADTARAVDAAMRRRR